uniref:G_PROTEIN_RECEP_F1_2 domain-containing protein n=2 Tax=Ascaris TaxID=6251 RepID=A0A0M3HPA0_ASCLU
MTTRIYSSVKCPEYAQGTQPCQQQQQHAPFEIYVRNVYPPIQELQPRILFVIAIFVLCFIVGVCGNSSILTIIRGVIVERRSSSRSGRRQGEHTILYIAALCVVDFLMSLSLPPAILDSIIGFWMFGTAICKLHHICGSVGRIVSTFLITAMSFDRFVAVCHPHKHAYRSRKFILSVIASVCGVAFLLLLPMLTYARANEVLLHQLRQADPVNRRENVTRVRVYKCSDMMPPYVFYWFTCSTFLLGYVVPLVLIVYFNCKLVRRLYRHSKVQPRSGIPLRRVATYTILIAVFYFVCWTPYWCSVLYAIYMSIFSDARAESSELLLFVIYCVHLLPYFGSASNWILYGLLNTQLQMKHDAQHSNDEHVGMMRPQLQPSLSH